MEDLGHVDSQMLEADAWLRSVQKFLYSHQCQGCRLLWMGKWAQPSTTNLTTISENLDFLWMS